MDRSLLLAIWAQYAGRILCSIIGFILGIILFLVGFWKMLILVLFVAGGFFIGRQLDAKKGIKQIMDDVVIAKWLKK